MCDGLKVPALMTILDDAFHTGILVHDAAATG